MAALLIPQSGPTIRSAARPPGHLRRQVFSTRSQLGAAQIRAALAAGIPRGVILGDAAYGDDCRLWDELTERGLACALGMRPQTAVWWGKRQPGTSPPSLSMGRPPARA